MGQICLKKQDKSITLDTKEELYVLSKDCHFPTGDDDLYDVGQKTPTSSLPVQQNLCVRVREYYYCSKVKYRLEVNEVVAIMSKTGTAVNVKLENGMELTVPKKNLFNDPNEMHTWFHDLNRMNAEYNLKNSHVNGTYLVRPAKTDLGSYALSVLCIQNHKDKIVKHFSIHCKDNVYVIAGKTYKRLEDLVNELQSQEFIKNGTVVLSVPLPQFKQVLSRLDCWELDGKDLDLKNEIGRGGFGAVYAGIYKNKLSVAIKLVTNNEMKEKMIEEARLMSYMYHPHIITIIGVSIAKDTLFLVMPMMKNGNLKHFLKENKNKISFANLICFTMQISDGMKYLESKQVVHRDLAARNILLDDDYNCKVSDFGLSKFVPEEVYTGTVNTKYPVRWTDPHFMRTLKYTSKCDIWSFGVLMYEIATFGDNPYNGMNNEEILNFLENDRLSIPKNCEERYYNLMLECWHEDPSSRPTFESIFDYLLNYNETSGNDYQPQD